MNPFKRFPIPSPGSRVSTVLCPPVSLPLAAEEVLIHVKAVAINPADVKMIDSGQRGASWPLVPGLDGVGVVGEVGKDVRGFKPGDRVLALFTPGDRAGAWQEVAVVEQRKVAKLASGWGTEEGASLGVCFHTAVVGLGLGLRMPMPFLQDGPGEGFEPSSVLVLGGSSALGAAVLQLLRLVLPGAVILTTSSPRHHSHLVGALGADEAFDRGSGSLIADVRSATPGSRGVDAIVDVVGAARAEARFFEVFNPEGPKRYAQVWTGEDEIVVPSGVDSFMFRSRDALGMQGGANIVGALQTLLAEGKYKLPLPILVAGHGMDGLQKGLDLMRKGVSGQKLVVAI